MGCGTPAVNARATLVRSFVSSSPRPPASYPALRPLVKGGPRPALLALSANASVTRVMVMTALVMMPSLTSCAIAAVCAISCGACASACPAASRGGRFLLALRRLPARPVPFCLPCWGGREEERRVAVATLGGVAGDGASAPAARRRQRHRAARRNHAVVGCDREPVAMRAALRDLPDNPRRPRLLMLLCGVPIPISMLSSRRREDRTTLIRRPSTRILPAPSSASSEGRNTMVRGGGRGDVELSEVVRTVAAACRSSRRPLVPSSPTLVTGVRRHETTTLPPANATRTPGIRSEPGQGGTGRGVT